MAVLCCTLCFIWDLVYCVIYVSTQVMFYLHHMNYLFPIFLIVNLSAKSPIIIHVDWTSYPLQSIYFSFSDQLPSWVIFLIPILSNDIELNPGNDLNKGFISLCTWNLNTINVFLYWKLTMHCITMILFPCVKLVLITP